MVGGSVLIDLDTPGNIAGDTGIEGNIDFGSSSGSIDADDDITIIADAQSQSDIDGQLDAVGDAITLLALNGEGDISVNSLLAREYIYATAGRNIVTGVLEARENASGTGNVVDGYAIKLDADFDGDGFGDITVIGTTTAVAGAGLNVFLDPANVTANSDVNVTGNYDVFATNNININADIFSSGGRIVLLADNDGTGFPTVPSGADGAGDLTMATATSLTTSAGVIILSGESLTLGDISAGGGNALTLTADMNNDGGGTVTLNGLLRGTGTTGNFNAAGVTVNVDPNNTLGGLEFNGTGTLTLGADLQAAGDLDIEQAITLTADSTISGDLSGAGGDVTLQANLDSNVADENDLTISSGSGNVSVQGIGETTSLNSIAVATTGTTTLNGNLTAENDIDLSASTDVDLGADIAATSSSGDIFLNGGNVAGAQALTLTASQGDIFLDTIGVDLTGLTVSAQGTALLDGDITVASGNINFSGSTNVALQDSITLTSGGSNIDLGSTNNTSVNGAFTLTLVGGAGSIFLDNVDTTGLTLTSGGATSLRGDINVVDAIDFSSVGAISLDATAGVASASNVTFDAGNTIDGANDFTVSGDTVTLGGVIGVATGTNDLSVTGATLVDVDAAVANADTISLSGPVDLGADLTATAGAVTVNDNVLLSGAARTISATAAGGVITLAGDVSGDLGLTLNAATTGTVNINTLGASGNNPTSLDVNTVTANLSGDIMVDGGVTFSDTTTTTLLADVEIDTTGTAGAHNINFQDINGPHVLTISGGASSTATLGVDAAGDTVTELTALDVTAANVVVEANIDIAGLVDLNGDIDLDAPIGANTPADTIVFDGISNLGADVTASNDITFNDAVTLSGGARTITSNDGSIDLNGIVGAAASEDLTLSAVNGTVFAVGLGTGARLGNLDIDGLGAELGGNVVVTSIDTTGVGLTTLTANVTIDATANIDLGAVDGARILDINGNAASVVTLSALDIGSLTLDGGDTVTFNGAVNTLDAFEVGVTAAPAGAVTINRVVVAGGNVDLTGATIDLNANLSGESVDINSPVTIGAAGVTVTVSAVEDVTFSAAAAVTLADGAVIVSSDNANVNFGSTIDEAQDLSVFAGDTATFTGNVGAANAPTSLTVTAVNTSFVSTVNVGVGGLAVNGIGQTTTFNGDVTSAGDVEINDNVVIDTDITITSGGGAANLIALNGTVNDTAGEDNSLTLEGGSGNVILQTVGDTEAIALLDVNTTQAQLNGDLTVDGNVEFVGATTTTLMADLTIDTSGGADGTSVGFAVLNGNRSLTIAGGNADVTFGGAVTELTGLTVSSSDTVTVSAVIDIPGAISFTAAGLVDVDFAIGATTPPDSITIDAISDLGADLTATNDITFNDVVTLSGGAINRTITSNDGSIDLNAVVDAATSEDLTLSALNGTVFAVGLGTGTRLGNVDIDALAAELGGNIVATSLNTTGVGLTTLTADVTIDTTANIDLGAVDGARSLDIDGTAASVVTLSALDIGSLTVDGGDTVTFNGEVNTLGAFQVGETTAPAGAVTINNAVAAGGDVDLTGGTIDINANLSGETVDINSLVSIGAANVTVTVSAVEDVTFAGNADVTLAEGAVIVSSENADVNFGSTIDEAQDLSVFAGDTATFTGAVGAANAPTSLTVTAADTSFVRTVNVGAGGLTVNGVGQTTTFNGDVTSAGDVEINDNAVLDASITVTSGGGAGNVIAFNGTINDTAGENNTLTLAGGNGTVILHAVGDTEAIALLDVDTALAELNGDLTVDGNVRFDGATTTTLKADLTIDTLGGANGTIVDFAILNGNRTLTIAGGRADVDFNGAVTQLTGLTVSSSDTVAVDAAIDIPGAVLLTASDLVDINAAIGATTAADSVTINGATNLGADVTAVNDITTNDTVTLSGGDRTLTSDDGSVDLNATVNATTSGAQDLTLNALNGTIFSQGLGTGTRLGALDMNAQAAELGDDVVATSVDTTDVGLTTLAADTVDIDTVGGTTVDLGSLIGNDLTISAGTAVTLDDANIASLVIDDATSVRFDGDVATLGVVTVAGTIAGSITVASGGSIAAGDNVTLDADGSGDVNIGGAVSAADGADVTITAADDVTVDADVSAFEGVVIITASGGLVTINDPANLTGREVTVTSLGTDADLVINTSLLFNETGEYSFVSDDTITLGGNQSIIALADIAFDAVELNLDGPDDATYEILSAEASVDIGANVTDTNDGQILDLDAGSDVMIQQLTLDGAGSSVSAEAAADFVLESGTHVVDGTLEALAQNRISLEGGTVNAGNVALEGVQGVENDADIDADDSISLVSGTNITSGGSLTAGDDVMAVATRNATFNDAITAGDDVDLEGGLDVNTNGAVTAGGNVDLDAGRHVDANGAVDAGDDINIAAGNRSETSVLTAGEDISIAAGNDARLTGTSTAGVDVRVDAGRHIIVSADIESGDDTTLAADDNVRISADVTADTDGDGDGDLTVSADADASDGGNLSVTSGTLSGENVTLSGTNVTAQALTADSDGDGDGNVAVTATENATLQGAVNAGGTSGRVDIDTGGWVRISAPVNAGTTSGEIEIVSGGALLAGGGGATLTAATVDVDSGGRIGPAGSRVWIDAPRVELDTTGEGSDIRAYIVNNNFDPEQVLVAGTSGNDASIDVVFDSIHDGTGIDIATLTTGEDAHTIIVGMNGGVLNLNSLVTYNGDIEVTNDEDINVISVLAQDVAGGSDGAASTADDLNGLFNDAHNVVLTTNNGTNVRIGAGGIRADADAIINSSGDILDLDGSGVTNITAGNGIFLNAGDFIGETIDPLEIDAGQEGVLTFTGTGDRRPIWAVLNGVIDGTGDPTNLEFGGIGRTPPGIIIYNGISAGGPLDLELQILRSESFDTESRIFTGGVSAIFALSPQFFTHSIIINNFYFPAIPAIEQINQGRVRVYGVPEDLNVPIDINILLEQDHPFSAGTEVKSKSDLGTVEKDKKRKSGPFTKKKSKKKSSPLTKKDKKLEEAVKTSQVGFE